MGSEMCIRDSHQGVQLLDRRQPPIGVATVIGRVQDGRSGLRLRPGQLVFGVDGSIARGVRALLPGQAGDVVFDCQAVGTLGVARLIARILGGDSNGTTLRVLSN